MTHRWLLSVVFLVGLLDVADAAQMTGQLTGDWQQWNSLTIEARASRNLGQDPITTTSVDSTGQFLFDIPDEHTTIFLTAWPAKGSPHPLFLSSMPVPVVSETIRAFPMSAPAFQRSERQQIGAKKFWIAGLFLLLLLAFMSWFLRRILAKRSADVSRDTHPWLTGPTGGSTDTRVAAALTGIIGAVAGISLWGLNESLDLLEYTYFQEAYVGNNPIDVAISAVVAERAHAPGYSILLWFLTQISEHFQWLRMPALLAAMGCVWIVHQMTLRWTGQRIAAAFAALIAGLTPLAMRYSDDLSPYSLTALLTLTSTLFLLQALKTNQRRDWIGFFLASVGAFFLHYFAAFFVLGQFIAVVWIAFSHREPFWWDRLRTAIGWFALIGVLPLLWAPQVFRGFEISMHDNMVTGTVYAASEGFWPYLTDHLRVLVGLPMGLSWATWPCVIVLGLAYRHLLKTYPLLGRILLIPLLMVLALIALTYVLQNAAYGGRTYYGFRWLRGYVPAVAIPLAVSCMDWIQCIRVETKRPWAIAGVLALIVGVVACTAGLNQARSYERPAQQDLVHTLLSEAKAGDGVAVLPAGFYSVQTSYYMHEYGTRSSIHEGPPRWDHYTKPDGSDVVLYGPIRSYGIPLETVARHVDIPRLWIVIFHETAFGRPEFEPKISQITLNYLTQKAFPAPWYRQRKWEFTGMTLLLYETESEMPDPKSMRPDPTNPWYDKTAGCSSDICVPLSLPYRLLRYAPDGLDPTGLLDMINHPQETKLRFPTPAGSNKVHVRIVTESKDARANDITIDKVKLQFHNGTWLGTVPVWRNRPSFDVKLLRSDKAIHWPITVELNRSPFPAVL